MRGLTVEADGVAAREVEWHLLQWEEWSCVPGENGAGKTRATRARCSTARWSPRPVRDDSRFDEALDVAPGSTAAGAVGVVDSSHPGGGPFGSRPGRIAMCKNLHGTCPSHGWVLIDTPSSERIDVT